MIVDATGVSVSQQIVRVVLKHWDTVEFHAWLFCIEIATTRTFLEGHDLYEAQQRRFIVSFDEICFGRNDRSVYGYSRKGTRFAYDRARGQQGYHLLF